MPSPGPTANGKGEREVEGTGHEDEVDWVLKNLGDYLSDWNVDEELHRASRGMAPCGAETFDV